jgi:hypothetical protein
MKTVSYVTSVIAALTMAMVPAKAATYTGTGNADGGGANGEGISSVVINNNATDITFTINTSAAQSAYVQYFVLMQYVGQGASGSTALLHSAGALNGWGPSLGISTGENAFAATYNTGATPAFYSGGAWTQGAGVSYNAGGTGFTFNSFTLSLSSLVLCHRTTMVSGNLHTVHWTASVVIRRRQIIATNLTSVPMLMTLPPTPPVRPLVRLRACTPSRPFLNRLSARYLVWARCL